MYHNFTTTQNAVFVEFVQFYELVKFYDKYKIYISNGV